MLGIKPLTTVFENSIGSKSMVGHVVWSNGNVLLVVDFLAIDLTLFLLKQSLTDAKNS